MNLETVNLGKTIATVMIVLSVLAAVGYLIAGDYKRVAYWCAAAVLTWSVTY